MTAQHEDTSSLKFTQKVSGVPYWKVFIIFGVVLLILIRQRYHFGRERKLDTNENEIY